MSANCIGVISNEQKIRQELSRAAHKYNEIHGTSFFLSPIPSLAGNTQYHKMKFDSISGIICDLGEDAEHIKTHAKTIRGHHFVIPIAVLANFVSKQEIMRLDHHFIVVRPHAIDTAIDFIHGKTHMDSNRHLNGLSYS